VPNEHGTALFIDMLGFSALTLKHPDWIEFHYTYEDGDVASETAASSPSADQLDQFHKTLDRLLEQPGHMAARAFSFSDCAFIVFNFSEYALEFAIPAMASFIEQDIPVRMGIAHGTFHVRRLSMEHLGHMEITRAHFFGSAVVLAHKAEQTAGKGMRIFIDDSVLRDLERRRNSKSRHLPLKRPSKSVRYELDFLFDVSPSDSNSLEAERLDEALFDHIYRMRDKVRIAEANKKRVNAPVDGRVLRQYDETIAAMNRMRKSRGRRIVRDS
jgi:hypothetical protein